MLLFITLFVLLGTIGAPFYPLQDGFSHSRRAGGKEGALCAGGGKLSGNFIKEIEKARESAGSCPTTGGGASFLIYTKFSVYRYYLRSIGMYF